MTDEPRYSRPKVMLVDLDENAVRQVRQAGYAVTEGSLGTPQRVPQGQLRGDKYLPVQPNGRLPGFAEQELVVVQQRAPNPVELRPEDVPSVTQETRIWAPAELGEVDTRPVLANWFAGNAQRILEHGGIFVVFCDTRYPSKLVAAKSPGSGYGGMYVEGELGWSVWDLVPELNSFAADFDHGEEITPVSIDAFDVLAPHLAGATFNCTLNPGWREERWVPLARNKYGKTVAGALVTEAKELPDGTQTRGWVFLLPQVDNVGACVTALLDDVLSGLAPRLFPETERTAWLQEPAYELPAVREAQAQIDEVRQEAAQREAELLEAIEAQRQREGWLHTLLTGTGGELAGPVKLALEELGLRDVRKVDDEEEEKRTGRRREDLQVWGESPVMLVEVKGINGLPKEASALQVTKYLRPRMREWNRVDVRGLAVINHQRGLPALERDNVNTFQEDVLLNAREQEFGLLTTIDLFRLVRNKRRWGWPTSAVAPLLYQDGRIPPIPLHYEKVGVVDGFFEKAQVVTITAIDAGFCVGDMLACALPIDYEQQEVESIQLDGAPVEHVKLGQRVGIKTSLTKAQARTGVEVYRVVTEAHDAPDQT